MRKKDTGKEGWKKQLRYFVNTYTGLIIIAGAALLIELMTGIMFYTAQNYVQRTMELLQCREMNAVYLSILLSILKGAKTTGSKVVMKGVNDDIKNVFKLTGFISVFTFE